MWTAIHLVNDYEKAKEIEDKLKKEGFLVKVELLNKEEDASFYKILTPEFEAEDVQLALVDLGFI